MLYDFVDDGDAGAVRDFPLEHDGGEDAMESVFEVMAADVGSERVRRSFSEAPMLVRERRMPCPVGE